MRSLAAAAAALLVAAALVPSTSAQQAPKPKKAVAAKSTTVPGTKTCRYKTSGGQVKTWSCKTADPCCASETLNLYTCGSTIIGCL